MEAGIKLEDPWRRSFLPPGYGKMDRPPLGLRPNTLAPDITISCEQTPDIMVQNQQGYLRRQANQCGAGQAIGKWRAAAKGGIEVHGGTPIGIFEPGHIANVIGRLDLFGLF